MAHASRFKLEDVLGNECCHPSCYAPPAPSIDSPVPLCELHTYQVFKAVNRFVGAEKANAHSRTRCFPLNLTRSLGHARRAVSLDISAAPSAMTLLAATNHAATQRRRWTSSR